MGIASLLTQVLLCFPGHIAGAHPSPGTLAWVHLKQDEEGRLPHPWKLREENTGPFMWQGRALSPEQFVPRKSGWWAEAAAAAASSPPWKITQSATLPTGCQEMPCCFLKRSHLLRIKNNNVPAVTSLPFPLPPPCPGKSTGSVNKSLDSRSYPI